MPRHSRGGCSREPALRICGLASSCVLCDSRRVGGHLRHEKRASRAMASRYAYLEMYRNVAWLSESLGVVLLLNAQMILMTRACTCTMISDRQPWTGGLLHHEISVMRQLLALSLYLSMLSRSGFRRRVWLCFLGASDMLSHVFCHVLLFTGLCHALLFHRYSRSQC